MLRKRVAAIMAVILLMMGMTNGYCCDGLPKRRNVPLYVVADYAVEDGAKEKDISNPYCYIYPKGAFIYNWKMGSDGYIILDWGGDSTQMHKRYLSLIPPAVKAPIFVDGYDETVFIYEAPNKSSSAIAELEQAARIDDWAIYNSDFLFAKVDSKEGYVSLDNISQAIFRGYDLNQYGSLTVGNCEEWVSLRAEPSVKSERLMKVPKETVIEIWSSWNEEFCFCKIGDSVGYILSDYLMKS